MTDKQKSRANMTVDQVNLDRCICDIDLAASGREDCEKIRKHIRAIRRIFAGLPEEPTKFDIGDTIRPKGSKAEYTITSISGGCYHGKGWGLQIGAEKDYELVESTEDVDAQINSQNEALKQLNSALNSMEHGGHLPLDGDKMISNEEIDAMAEEISKDCEDEIDRQFEEIVDKHLYGKKPEMVDIDDLPLDVCNIQYASIDGAIKAHAEDYSFNIESELFQQLTPEQQKMWRKEIERAVLSGAYSGLNLARDERYEENRQEDPASEELKDEIDAWCRKVITGLPIVKEAARHFANWQKQQMMKDAVPGIISVNRFGNKVVSSWPGIQQLQLLHTYDKVKLIIIKEG